MQYIGYYYIFIPLLFIIMVAVRRHANVNQWLISTVPFVLVIIFMWATGRWEIPSVFLRSLFPILMIIACIVGYRRIKVPEKAVGKIANIINISINMITTFIILVMTIFAFNGYRAPEQSIDLKPPLREGEFIVLHGGTTPFINAHSKIRPQNHALDIVQINNWGMRASSIPGGAVLDDYVIFGASVFAPCAGEVEIAEDFLEDLIPPQTDTEHLAGNHVMINCDGFEVILAHLQKDSVRVKVGDYVTTATVIGKVGNTGNTSEPHLHIHVEKGGDAGIILNGKAVAFTINGEFLVRGDIF